MARRGRHFRGRKGHTKQKRKKSKKSNAKSQDSIDAKRQIEEPPTKKTRYEDEVANEESSSSESEEDISSYQQLISTLEQCKQEKPIGSDEEDSVDDEDDDDEEEEEEEEIENEEIEEGMSEPSGERKKGESFTDGNSDDKGNTSNVSEEEDEDDDADDDDVPDEDDVDSEQGEEDVQEDTVSEEHVDVEKGTEDKFDPFYVRLEFDLGDKNAEQLTNGKIKEKFELKWPKLGCLTVQRHCGEDVAVRVNKEKDTKKLHIRKRIADHLLDANKSFLSDKSDCDSCLSPLQRELFSVMNAYKDLLYPETNVKTMDEIRHVYCLHVLNHVVKCRALVLKHNNLLSLQKIDPDSDSLRDQGLTRPRVLIVVPFRHSAKQIVNIFIKMLLAADECHIAHGKRFNREYGEERLVQSKLQRPEDWEATFAGNVDDHFRIGMAVTRKGIRLYTDFYSSDIIIASPLGLRTVIGVEGDKARDYDFLSSIDILLFDQSDVFLMQNWEHIQHLMEHIHLQPKSSHDVDFSRVHMWTVNGWSKFYRQTLLFSSIRTPEINSLFNKYCHNYAGRVIVNNPITTGTICQIATALPQVFQQIECQLYTELPQKRFDYFVTKVLPHFRDKVMSGTLIFVPSYFDFIRLRNYFRKEEISFAQICEYTKQSNISRSRVWFFEKTRPLMIYTERFHFFRRYNIRGIKHIIFYQLPTYPHFYSEMCNMMTLGAGTENSCTALYSKYDAHRLSGIVGLQRCSHMLSSDKAVHMFVTGEES